MQILQLTKGFRIQGKPFKCGEEFLIEVSDNLFIKCVAYGTEKKTKDGIPCQLIKLKTKE